MVSEQNAWTWTSWAAAHQVRRGAGATARAEVAGRPRAGKRGARASRRCPAVARPRALPRSPRLSGTHRRNRLGRVGGIHTFSKVRDVSQMSAHLFRFVCNSRTFREIVLKKLIQNSYGNRQIIFVQFEPLQKCGEVIEQCQKFAECFNLNGANVCKSGRSITN